MIKPLLIAGAVLMSASVRAQADGKLPRPLPRKDDPVEAAKQRYEQEAQAKARQQAGTGPSATATPNASASPKELDKKGQPKDLAKESPAPDQGQLLKSIKSASCHTYMSTPFTPLLYVDFTHVYLLTRQEVNKNKSYKYSLIDLDFSDELGKRDFTKGIPAYKVFSLNGPRDVALLPHGSPPAGFTVISFLKDADGCGRGQGAGVTIPVRSAGDATLKQPARTLTEDYYAVTDSIGGRLYASYSKHQLRSLDAYSLQGRAIFTFHEGQIPLYWDPDRKHFYAWNIHPNNQILRMVGSAANRIGRIGLKPGEKLVQSRELFGLVKANVAKNSLALGEVKEWSGTQQSASYSISLPAANPVSEASVVPHFGKRLLIVYGGSIRAKQRWNSMFLYSYERRTLLAKMNVEPNEYIDSAIFSPDGRAVLVVVGDRKSHLHTELKIFDITKRAWVDIRLN